MVAGQETYRDQGWAEASVTRGLGTGNGRMQASVLVGRLRCGAGPHFEECEAFKQRSASHQNPFSMFCSLSE